MIFVSFSVKKIIIPCTYGPSLSHLTSCTPTKSNLYFANSLATDVSDPELCRLLTFHVPHLMSLFHCLVGTKGSVQFRGQCISSVRRSVFTARRSFLYLAQLPCWRITPFRLSTTAYSVYSQLLFILEAVPSLMIALANNMWIHQCECLSCFCNMEYVDRIPPKSVKDCKLPDFLKQHFS